MAVYVLKPTRAVVTTKARATDFPQSVGCPNTSISEKSVYKGLCAFKRALLVNDFKPEYTHRDGRGTMMTSTV